MAYYRLLLPLILVIMTCISCTKKEQEIVDNTPTRVTTIAAGSQTINTIKLFGEIIYLNKKEEVVSYGFKIYKDYTLLETIDLGKNPQVGIVEYEFNSNFELNEIYNFFFYVQTVENTYIGNSSTFNVNHIQVDNTEIIYASPGDTVTLVGSFEQLNETFSLHVRNGINHNVPFTLSPNKKAISFIMPSREMYHGEEANIIINKFANGNNFEYYLYRVKIAAKLIPPSNEPYSYNTQIKLEIIGAPRSLGVWSGDFIYFIENKKFIYNQFAHPYPREIDITKSSFRIGYIKGTDTIYLKETWNIYKPDFTRFKLNNNIIHPYSYIPILNMNYSTDVINFGHQFQLGNYNGNLYGWLNNDDVVLSIEDVPEGTYPLKYQANFFGPTPIGTSQIIVQKLKVNSLNFGTGHYEEEVTIQGNFQPDIEYGVITDDYTLFVGYPQNGTLKFPIQHLAGSGNVKFHIGYKPYAANFKIIETHIVPIKGITIEDFYPKKAVAGDVITVKGKGIKSNWYDVQIGNTIIKPVSVTEGELKFVLPLFNNKGKAKIYIQGFASTEEIEIL